MPCLSSQAYCARIALMLIALCFIPFAARADDPVSVSRDPWEGMNRKIFVFNDYVDRYALKPVARGYHWVLPQPVQDGISNVFDNLTEVRTVLNQALQGKPLLALSDTGRFLVNSTVGVVGIFDVATHIGLPQHDEDFGQTLGYWGVPAGPYFVLPLLGPSTVRDTGGLGGDLFANPVSEVDHVPTRNTVTGVGVVSKRADLLKSEEMITGDRYQFIRDAYLQHRDFLIHDGKVKDSFGDDTESP